MKNIIENNYYGILGVLPSSSNKQIVKNTKEINRYLQIDEQPKYPFDFDLYSNRTEKQVKTASNEILNPKINIIHFFFRVFIDSEKEKKFVMNLEKNLTYDTIMDYYNKFDKNSLNVKKNTAIVLLILLTIKKNIEKRIKEKQEEAYKRDVFLNFGKEHLKDVTSIVETSISLWKTLLENEQYLNDFIKLYKFYDEIGIVEDVYKKLKENLKQELIYIYSDISSVFTNGEYILKKYITEFNLHNTNLNLKQIDDIYREIDKQINVLKKMNISEDGIFDEQEKKVLDDFFSTMRFELNKLKEFGFYESSKTKILRDSIAKTVRIHSVDLFNNLQDTKAAIDLLDFCIEVAATENLKLELNKDRKFLEKVKKNDEEFEKYRIINGQIMVLKKINKSVMEVSPKKTKELLNITIVLIKKEFAKYKKLGIYDGSVVNQIRDTVSISIRNISVDFYNIHADVNFSLKLLNFSYKIVANREIKEKIKKDLKLLNRIYQNKNNDTFDRILGNIGCLIYIAVFVAIFIMLLLGK